MSGSVDEFLKSQNNSQDKGRCNNGIYLFGHGDGGGGPTRTIIERIKRVQNVDGLPKYCAFISCAYKLPTSS